MEILLIPSRHNPAVISMGICGKLSRGCVQAQQPEGRSHLNVFHGHLRVFVRNKSCMLPAAHHLEEVTARIFVEDTKGHLLDFLTVVIINGFN